MRLTVDLAQNGRLWFRLCVLVGIVASVGLAYWQWGDAITLEGLVRQEHRLRGWYDQRPLPTLAAAFAVYVLVGALALPGAGTALTLLYGWLFGFWIAVPVISFGSVSGASLAFLLSRYLFRDLLTPRLGKRLESVRKELARDGAFYLLLMRLSPLVPFYLINILMGLTTIRLRTFWWASQLGMLPVTCIYIYTGSTIPSLESLAEEGMRTVVSPSLIVGLTLLGLFPLATKKVAERWSKKE